ncbi:MAG: 2Fe-2S iron-sulfur cluster binding domain-containing protein [Gammaproteobacteria bacterium]|nr:MAG: 2Fe-2S iron-sulfur cluster binding domain-containing protein [Gammaproteobacteria bacterium]TLZ06116.1 MAG: 2Fe-2S iron-sulfur cluster binding domain-containing protein [Gammaproteobacteria bacterium]
MLRFHSLRVLDISPDAEDAVAISLEVPSGLREEYRGSPGQHVVVRVEIAGEEARRTYSLVNAPGEWPVRIVPRVHSQGRVSRYLAEELRPGDRLDVLPPNGSFTPREAGVAGGAYAAFAAGCGITPVMSVTRALLAQGASSVVLFYGNTGTGRAMCLEELLALKDRHLGRLSLHFVMSREPQEVELYNGRLDGARVRQFATTLFRPLEVRECFVCGPGDMIEQVSGALRGLGVPAGRIHAEHFTVASTASDAERREAAAAAAPGTAPRDAAPAAGMAEVTILMDGRRRAFSMRMNHDTVLEAAARAGIELPFSCRAGVCSTCRTKVVRGEVEMAQNYALEDWELEDGYVLACQSRVKTPSLELDYDEK